MKFSRTESVNHNDKHGLWNQYLIDLNTDIDVNDGKLKKTSKKINKKLDYYLMWTIGLSIGIYTFYVAVEQMIKQIGVFLK